MMCIFSQKKIFQLAHCKHQKNHNVSFLVPWKICGKDLMNQSLMWMNFEDTFSKASIKKKATLEKQASLHKAKEV